MSISNGRKKYKVAIIASHIIQYAVPLYKQINAHPDIELVVYFCSRQGLTADLKDEGFDMKLKWDSIDLNGLNYKFLKNYSPFPSLTNFFGLINPGIIHELRANKFDAIVIGGYFLCSYWLAFYGALTSRTAFFLSGEPPSPWRRRLRKVIMGIIKRIFMPVLLKKASAILYIGQKSRDYYLSFGVDIKNKMFFCPYSVDNDYYMAKADEFKDKKAQIKRELGIKQDYPVILFLSKLIKWKRPMLLLQAFARLSSPAVLVFVGSGSRYNSLARYIKRHDIKNVYFYGFQNYSQVPKFYAIADIFVLPSLGESWGLVVNEAMCFGLPIIATDKVMSSYDLIKDGENGYVFKANNKNQLQNRLEYLLTHSEKRASMGLSSLEKISKWNYKRWVEGLIGALESITQRDHE